MNTLTLGRTKISLSTQAVATLLAIVGAVAFPQFFHLVGRFTGLGTSLGGAFLPMHLPIILVGLLAGPYAGGIAGLIAPLVSYALTGMPYLASLPFMMVEVCFYGLSAGLLRTVKAPIITKVIISQVAGRIFRAVAVVIAVYAFGSRATSLASLLKSIPEGIMGLVLQWLTLPLIVKYVESKSK